VSANTAYPLKISTSLRKAATRLAKEDGVSLNHWINMAIAQKIGATETAEYYRRQSGEPQRDDLRIILDKIPDCPPEPGDEIPEDVKAKLHRPLA
jgi:hypothetical protein